jgi:hypothetical protein
MSPYAALGVSEGPGPVKRLGALALEVRLTTLPPLGPLLRLSRIGSWHERLSSSLLLWKESVFGRKLSDDRQRTCHQCACARADRPVMLTVIPRE